MAYIDLITSQHKGKPKFEALVDGVSSPVGDIASTTMSMPGEFDLDSAIGAQLDIVGEWVGLSRIIETPLTDVYFSLDTEGLGLDEGYIKGPYDPTNGLVSLNDTTYRVVIRAKIGANHWNGTIDDANDVFAQVFTGTNTDAFIVDHQDMSLSVYVVGDIPGAATLALLTGGYLTVKPAGVRIRGYFKSSVDGSPVFGLDAQNDYISGLDTGSLGISIL